MIAKVNLKNSPKKQKKLLTKLLTILLIILITFSGLFSFTTIVGKLHNTPTSFMGYSIMQISSGSMVNSGFNIGEKIVVKSVQISTLGVGDYIAFYVFEQNYREFDERSATLITKFENKAKYKLNIGLLFGFWPNEIKMAAKPENHSQIVFHQITKVYKDQNDCLWFKTKGSSNSNEDIWAINEKLVVGVYDNGLFSKVVMFILNIVTSSVGLIFTFLLPFLLCSIYIIVKIINHYKVLLLQLDIIENKKKLTDFVCIKNKIGFRMDQKTKIKVLAHANITDKLKYIPLLWEDTYICNKIKQYYTKKLNLMSPYIKLNTLKEQCNKMYKEGTNFEKIFNYYLQEMEKFQIN